MNTLLKPIPLFAYLISNSSRSGDTVLEPFLGSGTSMVAALSLNVNATAWVDPKYCQVIVNRMRALNDTLDVKINGKIV